MLLARKCLPVVALGAVLSLTGLSGSARAATCDKGCEEVTWYWHAQQTSAREWFGWQQGHDPHQLCVKAHESDTAGGYQAYDGSGNFGAYQDDQGTWDHAAADAGRPDLVGADIRATAWYDQENVNWVLFLERGDQPWGGRCQLN